MRCFSVVLRVIGILGPWMVLSTVLSTTDSSLLAAGPTLFIPAAGRVDMVPDPTDQTLYISTTAGTVLRYDLATDAFLSPYTLGGSLEGIDISPDGKTLVVADAAYGSTTNHIDVVNLATGRSQQIPLALSFGEAGTYSVAFTNDSSVLVSSNFAGSGWAPLQLVNLTTGSSTTLATIRQSSMLAASADHSVVAFEQSNISSGPVELYNVSNGTITLPGNLLGGITSGSVDGWQASLSVSGNEVVLTVVPEPGTLALLGVSFIGLLGFRGQRPRRPTRRPVWRQRAFSDCTSENRL